MKNGYAWTLLLTLLPLYIYAQKPVVQDGKFNGILPINPQGKVLYESIQSVETATKGQLLDRARNWVLGAFPADKDVLPVVTESTGRMLGKGNFLVNPFLTGKLTPTQVSYTLIIDINEGQYQATLSNFYLGGKKNKPIEFMAGPPEYINEICIQTDEQSRAILWSLNRAMTAK